VEGRAGRSAGAAASSQDALGEARASRLTARSPADQVSDLRVRTLRPVHNCRRGRSVRAVRYRSERQDDRARGARLQGQGLASGRRGMPGQLSGLTARGDGVRSGALEMPARGSHRFGTARVDTKPSVTLQPRFPPGFFFGERTCPTWEAAALGQKQGLQGGPGFSGSGGTGQNAGATWYAKSGGAPAGAPFPEGPTVLCGRVRNVICITSNATVIQGGGRGWLTRTWAGASRSPCTARCATGSSDGSKKSSAARTRRRGECPISHRA
jgi:hypothetical protein